MLSILSFTKTELTIQTLDILRVGNSLSNKSKRFGDGLLVEKVLLRLKLYSPTIHTRKLRDRRLLTQVAMVINLVVVLVVAQELIVLVAEAARWGEPAFLQNNQKHVLVDLAVQREHLVGHLTKHLVLNQVFQNVNSLDLHLAR